MCDFKFDEYQHYKSFKEIEAVDKANLCFISIFLVINTRYPSHKPCQFRNCPISNLPGTYNKAGYYRRPVAFRPPNAREVKSVLIVQSEGGIWGSLLGSAWTIEHTS